jgi:hypothetical protein
MMMMFKFDNGKVCWPQLNMNARAAEQQQQQPSANSAKLDSLLLTCYEYLFVADSSTHPLSDPF